MCRQRICFILHITAVLPSPVQCCEWEMFPQILHLPALSHCASLFPHSVSFGWGFLPMWEQVSRINNSGICSRLQMWVLCPNNFFKVIQNLSWFVCLSFMECFRSLALKSEITSTAPISWFCETWRSKVLSCHIFYFTFPRCLHFFSGCCSLAYTCSLHEALGSSQLAESDEQSHCCFCDDSFFTHFLGGSCFKSTPMLKVVPKSALWCRLPFFVSPPKIANLSTNFTLQEKVWK